MSEKLVEIPDYTQDDFTMTDAPYRFLQSFADNPFIMRQMLERMKLKASSVGIRSFMKLWENFCKSLSSDAVDDTQNMTDFDGLPDCVPGQLRSGRYVCDVNGVSVPDNFGLLRVVCPHPIAPIRRFKNVDTGEELLELWYRRGGVEGRIKDERRIVAKDTIATGVLGLAKFGVVVNKRNDKDLSAYLMDMEQYNYDVLKEEKSVKRLGWVGEGYDTFSPYVKDVWFDGEDDFGSMFEAVRECGDYDKWKSIIRKVRKEKTAARFYLAASFASVILKPCGLLPFLIHAWGGTENGKTVALMVAASVWADPDPGEYVTTFNGTRFAQETRAGFLNNLPMCLDELQIQTSQGVKDFDDIIYQLCEGVSKSQGKASGGLRKQTKWRNVILSNGEHTIIKPLSGGGARNRVIEIEAPNKIYSDLVGLCEVITNNYGHAGKEFVEWLMVPDNMERVRTLQKDFYHALLDHEVTEKQAGSASAILTADAIVTELIFRDGQALTVDEIAEVLLRKGDIDINRKTLEWLYDFVGTNSSHFSKDSNVEYWGRIDDDQGVICIIKSILDRELKQNGLDSKSFLAWAVRTGNVIPGKNSVTQPMKVPGTRTSVRTVHIVMPKEEDEPFTELPEQDELPF